MGARCAAWLWPAVVVVLMLWGEAPAANPAVEARGARAPRPVTPRAALAPDERETIPNFWLMKEERTQASNGSSRVVAEPLPTLPREQGQGRSG